MAYLFSSALARNIMEIIEISPADLLGGLTEFEAKYAPKTLYLEGDRTLINGGVRVSVVGTRKPTREGQKRAEIITRALVQRGIVVVSGLAAGIDTIAHETALASGGQTIAVLGTPVNKTFPAANKQLLEEIKRKNLAVSQFPTGYPSQPKNFPMRNRTMALLSDATIIVEAGEKSGTLHQGWEALRLGRLLFLLDSVANDPALSWPSKMIEYGAQVLDRENLDEALDELSSFTACANFDF